MSSLKLVILLALYFSICCAAEEESSNSTIALNATDILVDSTNSRTALNSTDNLENDILVNSTNTYFNYTGNINRIVGGRPLNIAEAPYQVALYDRGEFICGGSIISRDWILTAGHCIKGGGIFKIRAGSRFFKKGGVIREVRYAVVNSGYNDRTLSHDIGLLRLKNPLRFSKKIKPVHLAKPNMKLPKQLLVSGWGAITESSNKPSEILRGVFVSRVSHKTCRHQFRNDFPVSRLVICAASKGKDACQGDSGGPLVINGFQYGIVSFGIGCARQAFPGVYTNTRKQFVWIRNVIQRFGGVMPKTMRNYII